MFRLNDTFTKLFSYNIPTQTNIQDLNVPSYKIYNKWDALFNVPLPSWCSQTTSATNKMSFQINYCPMERLPIISRYRKYDSFFLVSKKHRFSAKFAKKKQWFWNLFWRIFFGQKHSNVSECIRMCQNRSEQARKCRKTSRKRRKTSRNACFL